MPTLSLVVAAARNRVIGANGDLPWRLPDDLKRFKAVTMGKPIVMGRATWESIGRPLPGRHNIVITRNTNYRADGCTVVHSLAAAIAAAGDVAEIMIIGGGQIYAEALPIADRVYLTEVDAEVDGDAFMPPLPVEQWREVAAEAHPQDVRHAYPFRFVELARNPERGQRQS